MLACAGDVPTLETIAAAELLRDRIPDLAIRVVNVVDLMRLQSDREHPHGLSDIEFDAESVLKLLRHGKDVVAGVYAKKYYNLDRVVTGEEIVDFVISGHVQMNAEGLIECTYAPTGFLMISRETFVKMMEAYPHLRYNNDIAGYGDLTTFYDFFQVSVRNGILESEDWGFCSLWRELGGKILIDPTISLGHSGWHTFKGNPWKWCQEAIRRNSTDTHEEAR